MCELLGMSSNHRTTINLSLTTLSERGENPKLHGDGWGVAFYEGQDVRLIKDTGEAKGSKWVKFITEQEIHSHDVIAHIRKSTMGEVNYSNTHPFVRELEGRMHTFAHNGTLHNLKDNLQYRPRYYYPVGSTDSEHAFCILMDRMYDLWRADKKIPSLEERRNVVSEFAEEMRALGALNFLYSDGEALFAHGHKRHNPITDQMEWPGINYIQVFCGERKTGFEESTQTSISLKGQNDLITLFASVPLNDDEWTPIKEGEVVVVIKGEIVP
jgi:predicted glutamine amidotransferase